MPDGRNKETAYFDREFDLQAFKSGNHDAKYKGWFSLFLFDNKVQLDRMG